MVWLREERRRIERKLELFESVVVTCMYSIYRLLWGLVLNHLCEVR